MSPQFARSWPDSDVAGRRRGDPARTGGRPSPGAARSGDPAIPAWAPSPSRRAMDVPCGERPDDRGRRDGATGAWCPIPSPGGDKPPRRSRPGGRGNEDGAPARRGARARRRPGQGVSALDRRACCGLTATVDDPPPMRGETARCILGSRSSDDGWTWRGEWSPGGSSRGQGALPHHVGRRDDVEGR
jgi:hypothetical protein